MKETQISLPPDPDFLAITRMIEETVTSSSLQINLRATLGKYYGSTHWHIKNGKDKGILEITLWPKQARAWFSVQHGRKADWIRPKIAQLNRRFKYTLKRVRRRRALKAEFKM